MSEQFSGQTPDELFVTAEVAFDVACVYPWPDADMFRVGAADAFELAAGTKILAELKAQGITEEQIERLHPDQLALLVDRLASTAMQEVRARIAPLDDRAHIALQAVAYDTQRRLGRVKND